MRPSDISRLARLTAREWQWLLLSVVALPLAALLVRIAGWQQTLRRLPGPNGPVERRAGVTPEAIARVVRIAATYGPYRALCLPQALVLAMLLRREGFDPAIVLGARKRARTVEAHAWVELDGTVLDTASSDTAFVRFAPSQHTRHSKCSASVTSGVSAIAP